MENVLKIIVLLLVGILIFLLIKNKKQKTLIFFLDNVEKNSKSVKSTRFLASLGIKNLNQYGYKLMPFYSNIFCLKNIAHLPEMVVKISQYIERLDKLKESKEKKYLKNIFRQTILSNIGAAFVIYQAIKIKHQNKNRCGQIIEEFLLDCKNILLLQEETDNLFHKINFYEASDSSLGSDRDLIRKNLDEVILKIKEKTNY